MLRRATLVPYADASNTVYMVLDDFGKFGRAWRQTDENHADERDIVHDIVDGEDRRPIKIVAFNLEERWARDVTEDIARAAIDLAAAEGRTLGPVAREFIERVTGKDVPADLIKASFG
jgi:hypothetical protein